MSSLLRALPFVLAIPLVAACESASAPQPATPQATEPAATRPSVADSAPAPPEIQTAVAVSPPAVTTPASPTPAAPPTVAKSGKRPIPALDTSCHQDADCAIGDNTVDGPEACCPGCNWHAANKASWKAFADACNAYPAPECPGLGCAMPIVAPKCVAGHCVAAKT